MRLPWMLAAAALIAVGAAACATTEPTADVAEPQAVVPSEAAAPSDVVPTVAGPSFDEVVSSELGADAEMTAGGAAYRDDVVGDGAEVGACDFAVVDYSGRLPDGTEFDTSVGRAPLQFTPGTTPPQVIPGWDEGVRGMKVGGERTLVVPPELAYGETGAPPMIPPGATLVFDIKLLRVASRPELPDAPAEVAEYEVTDSGLEYAILEPGEGDVAQAGDRVHVHYTGWLEDGTQFDSSLTPDRCEAIAFVLGTGEVIKGWDEGVAGMTVGEKRQLRIPPGLAYGDGGNGLIPPNSTLVFDVQLVGIDAQ